MSRFVSWNVNGIKDSRKISCICQMIADQDPDFILLQEIRCHSTDPQLQYLEGTLSKFGYSIIYNANSFNISSCGVLIAHKCHHAVKEIYRDTHGRVLSIICPSMHLSITNIYAPVNASKSQFDEIFQSTLNKIAPIWNSRVAIIGGDLNQIMTPHQLHPLKPYNNYLSDW